MDSIEKIYWHRYVCGLLVADRLAGGDVIVSPCSLLITCGIRGQRIDCAWYFDEIGGLHYDLYIFPKLMLAVDLVVNHQVLHDMSR